jgi:A/G-specific adenine glycosylase
VVAAIRSRPAAPIGPEAQAAILTWYRTWARGLPFRSTADPYAILVSEAMAQQTQAARAGDAWIGFMTRFPTVESLASAQLADVLRAWRGLGYNRRAVSLWKAARRIVAELGGEVPADIDALQTLPGVGPYTARAVAAIAFGRPVGAVDTNVRRVLGRIIEGDDGRLTTGQLQDLADAVVPRDRPGSWTHALMDLGATLCRPRRPRCDECPAAPWCSYAATDRGRGHGSQPATTRRDRRAASSATPFPLTARWLRGRIVDRLRDAPEGAWVDLEGPIGDHDQAAVDAAVETLSRDGLVELGRGHPARRPIRARLPVT